MMSIARPFYLIILFNLRFFLVYNIIWGRLRSQAAVSINL